MQRPDVRAQPIISFALAGPSAPRNFTHARRVQRAHWQATGDDDAAGEDGDAHAARAAHGGASFVTFEATPDEVSTGYKGPPMQTDVSCCCLPCVALPAPSLAVQPGTVPITRFLQPASFQCCGFPSAAPPCLYPWSLPCFCGRPNTYCGPPAFTLRDVVGTTSSALGDFVRGGVGRDGCLNDCLLDRATDWAAQNWALQRYRVSPSFDGRRAQDLLFVDGGMHDCSALPALLRRKCTRVVQFFSGPQPYATLAESGGALRTPVGGLEARHPNSLMVGRCMVRRTVEARRLAHLLLVWHPQGRAADGRPRLLAEQALRGARCSRDAAEMQPRCSRDAAGISRDVALRGARRPRGESGGRPFRERVSRP